MDSERVTTTDSTVIVTNGSRVKIKDANDVLC